MGGPEQPSLESPHKKRAHVIIIFYGVDELWRCRRWLSGPQMGARVGSGIVM